MHPIETHYHQYIKGIQCRLHLPHDEAQEFLHEIFTHYWDPGYHDQFKYQNGQLILFDQYVVKRCAQASQKEIPCET